jgi:hypothetical protein
MLSFGLYVVSTRRGHSTIDLICISGAVEERMTILVEAKTSKKPYTFPKKDARALKDYIIDVQRTLTTLPPLSLVLVAGPSASKTVSKRIRFFESEAGVPVRFIAARQLAALREAIPGPLPLRAFFRSALNDDHVLGDDFVGETVKSYHTEQRAHEDFVESVLGARGVIPRKRGWASSANHDNK